MVSESCNKSTSIQENLLPEIAVKNTLKQSIPCLVYQTSSKPELSWCDIQTSIAHS